MFIYQRVTKNSGLASRGNSSPTVSSGPAAPRNRCGSAWILMCCRRPCAAFGSTNRCTKALTKDVGFSWDGMMGWGGAPEKYGVCHSLEVEKLGLWAGSGFRTYVLIHFWEEKNLEMVDSLLPGFKQMQTPNGGMESSLIPQCCVTDSASLISSLSSPFQQQKLVPFPH